MLSTDSPHQIDTERAAATDALDALDLLDPSASATNDPLDLIDHRTRMHLVNAERAAPGRYLAIDTERDCWMLPLRRRSSHIGRGHSVDVRIDDSRVSRLHAIVMVQGGEVHLLDSRSLNGTHVNGHRVMAARLRHGDVVRIGPLTLRYVEVPFQLTRQTPPSSFAA